ncbi:23S rRNA (uracil(1939)-C(5))-methyltransferase RlmD [Microbulbifer discodermiae]|uniref:23S rRNA (uracil(1939)-C(5))-methyltransferase RlmD n=1 Tax=Microbulbifer sp. 2201CG32-9 TaxID=3232309 RepID=UPI00345BC566
MKPKNRRPPVRKPSVTIEKLSHEVRGIARHEGKTLFVDNALPGETVKVQYTSSRSKFDEAVAVEVLQASPHRCEPLCRHADVCGGCALQHMQSDAQIRAKQEILQDQLRRIGGLEVTEILPPLVGEDFGYRRRARLGVRASRRTGVIVGFREKRSNKLVPIEECPILAQNFDRHLAQLRRTLEDCAGRSHISHIELALGEDTAAAVLRHLEPLPEADLERWRTFSGDTGLHIYLQPGDDQSVRKLWPQDGDMLLQYTLPQFDLAMRFHPLDFIQVNFPINRKLVGLALTLLDPQADERLLDLFCGLGNFTLPLARRAREVVGVEGANALVQRGIGNADYNGLANAHFHTADLTRDITKEPWARQGFDKILLDPPRTGAHQIVDQLARFGASRVVYVSCNPATLARDAALFSKLGYSLTKAGAVDMFPQTAHVESIALFERGK